MAIQEEPFVDHYEVLQVSPNVDAGTIERVFRYLAKRFHPDNPVSGSTDLFDQVVKAYRVLTDTEQRAAFDVRYQRQRKQHTTLATEAADIDDLEADRLLREQILHLLYVKRRRDLDNPGIGAMEIEHLVGRPREQLQFHFWYMREKTWIERTESGHLAITANGVEQVETNLRTSKFKLIEDQGRETRTVPPGGTARS